MEAIIIPIAVFLAMFGPIFWWTYPPRVSRRYDAKQQAKYAAENSVEDMADRITRRAHPFTDGVIVTRRRPTLGRWWLIRRARFWLWRNGYSA